MARNSLIGDLLKPKPFAGILAGAPSVALATLALTFTRHDAGYVALEGRSMLAGAVALVVYAVVVSRMLLRREGHAPVGATLAAVAGWLAWLAVALGIWAAVLR